MLVVMTVSAFWSLLFPGRDPDGKPRSRAGLFIGKGFLVGLVALANARFSPENLRGIQDAYSTGVTPRPAAAFRAPVEVDGAGTVPAPLMMTVEYGEVQDPRLYEWATWAHNERLLESYAEWVNSWIRLPAPVTLRFAECGRANAFYRGRERAIVLCLEMLDYMGARFTGSISPDAVGPAVDGAARFILSHELGHALIHLLDLPALGGQEDAADQLAAFVMLDGTEDGRAAALHWVVSLGDEYVHDVTRLAGEHSLNGQRRYNLLCWMYGQDPMRNVRLISEGHLPAARAERCGYEYQRMNRDWNRLLGPHLIR